ncbi:hypothetical protein FB45DRAFT_1059421 [Roridomyces roridus]|uniref:RING-type domain-containing protein n=1 Tax=Roridomyces roridus TaxID=1738132 RepID=A0AAD7BSH6_9AGAR|nr:hypothetical protein FB45DRAFT_1059421 [Roridomyces roridus]
MLGLLSTTAGSYVFDTMSRLDPRFAFFVFIGGCLCIINFVFKLFEAVVELTRVWWTTLHRPTLPPPLTAFLGFVAVIGGGLCVVYDPLLACIVSLGYMLSVATNLATHFCWILLRRPTPWFLFNLALSLLLLPVTIPPVPCLIHYVYGASIHPVFIVVPTLLPILLDAFLWIYGFQDCGRKATSAVLAFCASSIPQTEEQDSAPETHSQEPSSPQPSLQKQDDRVKEHLQCSICLGFLRQPYATACGHVFDAACLAHWFIAAPPFEDLDLDLNPSDPHYMWYRSKTCPFCRTVLDIPPTPLFFMDGLLDLVSDGEDEEECNPLPVIVDDLPSFLLELFAYERQLEFPSLQPQPQPLLPRLRQRQNEVQLHPIPQRFPAALHVVNLAEA